MPNIINRTSRKPVNQVLSVLLGLSMLVWLGGFAAVTPSAEAQSTADLVAQLQAQIAALQAQLAALAGQQGSAAVCSFTRSLFQGVSGEDVRCLQRYLNSSGNQVAASGAGSPGSETTYFGLLTKAAVARWQAANGVSPAAGYFGPISRAKYSSMVGVGPAPVPGQPPSPLPVGSQVGVSLAPTTPPSGVTPIGATGVRMLSINFTAPFAGEVTVTDVVIHRNGVGRPADFSQVYLYDGSNRLTSGRTVNTSSNNSEFHNLSIKVPAGQTKTIDVVADMSSTALAGDVNYLEVVSASSIGANAAVVGTFPIRGNNFSVAGATAGTVTIADLTPSVNPKVGDLQVEIAKFSLAASSAEDLSLRRITLYNGGNISSGNIGNFKLTSGGNTLATAVSMSSQGYVVFDLATPHVINKGNTLNYEVLSDILSGARANDTLQFRLDQAADLLATGNTYGFGAVVTNNFSTGTSLTIQGGEVTVTFNGPVSNNWSRNTTGVELLNFSINTKNNTEFRAMNLTLGVASTSGGAATPSVGDGTNTYFTNVRVLNTTTGLIVAGPQDAGTSATATSTGFTFTDRWQQNAGTTNNYKILVDAASSAIQQDVRITLLATSFTTSGNVKNIDNNTNITNVVPTTNIQGNLQHILAQALTLSLAGTPVSQTYVRGSQNVDMLGLNFTAGLGGDVKINAITTTAYSSASTGTFATSGATPSSRVLALKLVDQSTGNQVGTTKGVGSSDGKSTFDNLNFTVPAGTTKTVLVRADMSNNALSPTDGERIKFDVAATTDVSSVDSRGTSVTISGAQPNSTTADSGTRITVGDAGTLSVVKAPSDAESQQGIIIAGSSNSVLAKYRITATNESLKITKARMIVDSGAVDSVNALTLWDGPTQIGGPVVVNSDGTANFNGISFTIPKDTSKVLTAKGNLNTISGGADSGDSVTLQFSTSSNFEAVGTSPGSSTQLTNYSTAASNVTGSTMTLRKTKPTVTVSAPPSTVLVTGTIALARIKVAADAAEQVALKGFRADISLSNATLTADSLQLYDLDTSETLTLASGTVAANGGLGAVGLSNDRVVTAGGSKNFELRATVSTLGSGAASVTTKLRNASDTALVTGTNSSVDVAGATRDFVWSDFSVVGHTESSGDYTTARDVKDFNTTVVVSKSS